MVFPYARARNGLYYDNFGDTEVFIIRAVRWYHARLNLDRAG